MAENLLQGSEVFKHSETNKEKALRARELQTCRIHSPIESETAILTFSSELPPVA